MSPTRSGWFRPLPQHKGGTQYAFTDIHFVKEWKEWMDGWTGRGGHRCFALLCLLMGLTPQSHKGRRSPSCLCVCLTAACLPHDPGAPRTPECHLPLSRHGGGITRARTSASGVQTSALSLTSGLPDGEHRCDALGERKLFFLTHQSRKQG